MTRPSVLTRNHNKSLIGISNEHAHLIDLLETLQALAAHKPVNRVAFATTLRDLRDELDGHFRHEEELMLEIGHLQYIEHKQHHTQIHNLIEDLLREYQARDSGLEDEAIRLIEKYKDDHMEKFDREMVVLVSEKF